MAEHSILDDAFRDQPKLRAARIFTPLNALKQKVGGGGLDPKTIAKAEQVLENNTVDFRPIALDLLKDLDASVENARKSKAKDENAIEAMIQPAAQFLALGSLFHFPLISELSDNLVSFLETVTTPPDEETLEIVIVHRMAISVVLKENLSGKHPQRGVELKRSLVEACHRYYKTRKS